jgi:hypothetical protein
MVRMMTSAYDVPRPRLTIGKMMLLILGVGLALAPVEMIRRHADPLMIVALVGFEIIGLPALVTIVLMATMKPGRERIDLIMILSWTPVTSLLVLGGLWGIGRLVYEARRQNYSYLFMMAVCMLMTITLRRLSRPRCLACTRRPRLRVVSSRREGEDWFSTERYRCNDCGAQFHRVRKLGTEGPLLSDAEVPSPTPEDHPGIIDR